MKQRGEIAEDLDTKQTAETPLTFRLTRPLQL